jgi:hypothetical protein
MSYSVLPTDVRCEMRFNVRALLVLLLFAIAIWVAVQFRSRADPIVRALLWVA